MIAAILTDTVNVTRRTTNPSYDALNNPVYGSPDTWPLAYQNVRVRLAWTGKAMEIKNTGELIYPTATIYLPKNISVLAEDRIITISCPGVAKGIEYVVEAVWPAYIMHGVVDHFEGSIHLPL